MNTTLAPLRARALTTALACLAGGSAPALAHAADAPAAPASASAPASAASAADARAPRFDIWEYEIAGNTVLDASVVEEAVQPWLGPGKRMSDVEGARNALEQAYQKAGFLTVGVDIPEQQVNGGVVQLRVIEGRLGGLYVLGSRYHSQGWIRTKLPELQPGRIPDFTQVQEQLAWVNRSEDRRVQPVLRPGKLPGTVDIDLQVTDQLPLSGNVEINNQHSKDTTGTRLVAGGRYDNLFQLDHSLALTLQLAPQKPAESEVLIANYAVPLNLSDTLQMNGVFSNSNVDTLGGTQVLGKGTTLGLRWQHPESAGPNAWWNFQLGADFKSQRQRTEFGSDAIETPLRYLPFQLGAYGQWAQGSDRVSLNTSGTFALRPIFQRSVSCPAAGGNTQQDQFSCSHYGSDGSFGLVKGELRASHDFGRSSLSLRLGAQFASQPLVSAEQYALGGADTVRGYYEGEASGDEGALASLEWRANLAPALASGPGMPPIAWMRELSLGGFVDAGLTYNIEPAAGQAGHTALLSVGTGLKLATRQGLEGTLDLAWPQKPAPGRSNPGMRLHARMAWRF